MKKLSPFFFLFLVSCADPKYVNEVPPTQNSQKSGVNCEYRFQKEEVCLSYSWQQYPSESQPGIMVFRLFKPDPVDGFPFLFSEDKVQKVALRMPSMSHGSAPTLLEKLSDGTYQVSRMYFVMPGEWEIRFQNLVNGQIEDEAVVPFNF